MARSPKAGPACLPRQGRPGGTWDADIKGTKLRLAEQGRLSREGLDELVPESRGAQPPSPTPGQGRLPVGPAQRPSPWEVPPWGAELLRGVPAL